MSDLQRLLETQNFKNDGELDAFLQKYQSEGIPEFPEEVLNNEEKAEDKIYQAYDTTKAKGLKLAQQALKLDKNCIMAYQYLAEHQKYLSKSIEYYKKGIAIGNKKFGGKYEEENKGHFWMIFETRPYMTCLFNLSECEYLNGNIDESIRLIEYLLELNPNDNQGVRYILSSHLLEAEAYDKYEKHAKANQDDGGVFFAFNNTLFEFIRSKDSIGANALLSKAREHNKYVIPMLSKNAKMLSNSYSMGSKEEADYYCEYNAKLWQKTEGAIEWALQRNK